MQVRVLPSVLFLVLTKNYFKMKKLFIVAILAISSFTLFSCGKSTGTVSKTDTTTVVTDSIQPDSAFVDSVQVDSVK